MRPPGPATDAQTCPRSPALGHSPLTLPRGKRVTSSLQYLGGQVHWWPISQMRRRRHKEVKELAPKELARQEPGGQPGQGRAAEDTRCERLGMPPHKT